MGSENERNLTSSQMLNTALELLNKGLAAQEVVSGVQKNHQITLLNPEYFLEQARKLAEKIS